MGTNVFANIASRLVANSLAVIIAANIFAAGPASAAVPTQKQMEAAMGAFDTLQSVSGVEFKARNGAAEATIKTKHGGRATLLGYLPDGKKTPIVALIAGKVNLGKFMDGPLNAALDSLALKNVVIFLVAPGQNDTIIKTNSLPKALRDSMKKLSKDFYLERGVNLFANLDAQPVGLVGDVLKTIGLKQFKDIVIKANIQKDPTSKKGFDTTLRLKKTKKWNNPFHLKSVNKRTTSLNGLTVLAKRNTLNPKNAGISAWGEVQLNKKKYLLYAQHSVNFGKPGKAYGIDAKSITLQSLADFAAAMPWSNDLASKALQNLPLSEIKLENPQYKPFDYTSNAAPTFQDMIMVAATPGVPLPDYKPLPVVGALKKGTIGPLLYANGVGTIFGQKVGNFAASMSVHGLTADANVNLRQIGPIRFSNDIAFHLGPKKGEKLVHEMTLSGKAGIHGLPSQSVILKAELERLGYHIPSSCPLNPAEIKGSVPFLPGMALNGIKDFEINIGISDCFSDAILGLVKDPKKVASFAKNMAEDQIALGITAATAVGASIVNADKTLKSAWKGSIDAGQTAANTVKNLDKKIAGIGKGIAKAGKAIKDLSKSIKSIGKSIARAFTGITGLKKKKKRKKRARAKKEAEKRKLEQKKRSAQAARTQAKKALGKMSPYFNADVVEARTSLSGLRFERKLAAERQKFAEQLKTDFETTSKRGKLIAAVNIKAIMAEYLTTSDATIDINTPVADLNKRLLEKQALIEEQIVAAAFDKAMAAHMAKVKPDPEPEVPFGKPIRIVGEYNLCLEAYRGVVQTANSSPFGGSLGRQLKNMAFTAAKFKKDKLRINNCHAKDEKPHDNQTVSTQRFMMTPAGKLLALFGKENVCFEGNGSAVSTTLCKDHVSQVFFYDPTITSIRPMLAKKGQEPTCLQRRYSARAGAQVQLSSCRFQKSGKSLKTYQQWRIAKWTTALPKKMDVPKLSSLWTHYGKGYGKARSRVNNGIVSLDGLIKLRIADQGSKTRDFAEPIDILPPELRPDKRLIFDANSHFGTSRIDISPNGRVQWVGGNKEAGWVSLDNISYPVKTGKTLKLNSGCKTYKKGKFRTPSYSRNGNQVVLSGLMACQFHNNKHIATLPKGDRPSKILVFTANTHNFSARIDVHPNGKVWWVIGWGARHGWVSLDGIAFDLPKVKKTALPLIGNCKTYGVKKFAAPTVVSKDGMVRLSGMVDCLFRLGQGHSFATLPKNMRPAKRHVFHVNAHERSVRVDVLPNGMVRLQYGWRQSWTGPKFNFKNPAKSTDGRGWLSLDGISFSISGTKKMALKW